MSSLQAVRWGPARHPANALIVLCHGLGANGHDLMELAPTWSDTLPHAAFASPHAPELYEHAPPMGRQWFDLSSLDPAHIEAGTAQARPLLDAFLDEELARMRLPPDAYALMGFSQGAMMALYTGLRRPVGPRAILAFSGALVAPQLLGERANAAPVLLVHGEEDEVVPAGLSHLAAEALQADGVAVETRFIPGLGHSIDEAGLAAGAAFLQRTFAAQS